jgi:hypothetical protein
MCIVWRSSGLEGLAGLGSLGLGSLDGLEFAPVIRRCAAAR